MYVRPYEPLIEMIKIEVTTISSSRNHSSKQADIYVVYY